MYFQIAHAIKFIYIWLHIAIHAAYRRPGGAQDNFYSVFTTRKLAHTTPS